MPTVVRDLSGSVREATGGSIHVAGARAGDTVYMLDGFEAGDPITGELTTRVAVEAVRDVEVESGNLGANYAHAAAGVMAIDTASGDDRWRFGITNFIPAPDLHHGMHVGNWYPRLEFSGPIEKGRLWFSDAITVQRTFVVVTEQPPGSDSRTQWVGDNLLRMQFKVSARQTLYGSFLYDRESDTNQGLTALAPVSTTTDVTAHRYFSSLKDQIWFENTLVEFGVAADTGTRDVMPQGTQPYVELPDGFFGNYFQQTHQLGRRLQAMGNIIGSARQWHGTHQFAVGFNAAALTFEHAAVRNEIDAERSDGTLLRQTTFAGPASFRRSNTQAGAYALDIWKVKKWLVLQGGVRIDGDRLIGRGMVEPRISVNLLPKGGARAKLTLGWGIYNEPLDLAVLGQGADQQQVDVSFDSTGTTPVGAPVVSSFVVPVQGLRQPRFQTESAEWKEKFGPATLVSLRLTARDERDGFDYAFQPVGNGFVFLLQNGRRDRYRAAEVSVRHSFGESAEVFGSYTRSTSRTNTALDPALGTLFFAPQASGPLPWDAPNRLVAWGWTPLPIWKLFLSSFVEYRTGFPFSAINQEQRLVGAPGSRRFPTYVNVNLGLEKQFRFRSYIFAVRAGAIHILGRQDPDTVVNVVDALNFGTFSGGEKRALTFRLRFVGRK
jgi:hypothetical protein